MDFSLLAVRYSTYVAFWFSFTAHLLSAAIAL
ncbi:hypothetical protein T4A_911 [Trichinella pseudospiralis]|uniref:Uncharacterized protein n=1 Tax=Trichinella pseudospiralis TaxID=6337 RepID=A0A0V1DGW7_TRIPS|nr:hypothetical protein T4A_911 [Trichinella pseudospiralis]